MARSRLLPLAAPLFLFALGFAMACSAPARGEPVNLLRNPGFEEGLAGHPWMPTGWDTSRAGLETVFFGRDNFSAHSGQSGVSVASMSGTLAFAHHWGQSLLVTPDMWGKDLLLSVWTRSNGVEGRGYVLLQAFRDTISKMAKTWDIDRAAAARRLGINAVDDPAIDLGWKRVVFSEAETDWVQRVARVYLPPSTNIVFVRCGIFGTGQVMLDDASLTLEDPLPAPDLPLNTNLLSDPGFETEPDAWEYSVPPYPDLRATRDSVVFHSGHSSQRFVGGHGLVMGTVGVAQVLCNRNLEGKRLRFTAYVRTESLKTSVSLKIFGRTGGKPVQETSSRTLSGTNDWTQVIVERDMPDGAFLVWVWVMYMAPSPGQMWIDDASLVVTGPATGQPTPVQPQFEVEKPAPPGAGKARPSSPVRPRRRR